MELMNHISNINKLWIGIKILIVVESVVYTVRRTECLLSKWQILENGPNVIFLRFHIQTPIQKSFVQFDWLIRKTFARCYWLKKQFCLTSCFKFFNMKKRSHAVCYSALNTISIATDWEVLKSCDRRRKKGKDISRKAYGLRGRLVYLALPWRLNIYFYGVLFYIFTKLPVSIRLDKHRL